MGAAILKQTFEIFISSEMVREVFLMSSTALCQRDCLTFFARTLLLFCVWNERREFGLLLKKPLWSLFLPSWSCAHHLGVEQTQLYWALKFKAIKICLKLFLQSKVDKTVLTHWQNNSADEITPSRTKTTAACPRSDTSKPNQSNFILNNQQN